MGSRKGSVPGSRREPSGTAKSRTKPERPEDNQRSAGGPETEPSAAEPARRGLSAPGVGSGQTRAMAAEGAAVAGGGTVGGRLAKDSLRQSKGPDAAPKQRRGSAQSRDAERRAYLWCREYLGGAWRRVRPEELRVDPIRWEVRGQPMLQAGRGREPGAGSGPDDAPRFCGPVRTGQGGDGRAGRGAAVG